MGWYGIFLVTKLKLAFNLRSMDEGVLDNHFDSLERFFDRYLRKKDGGYLNELYRRILSFR